MNKYLLPLLILIITGLAYVQAQPVPSGPPPPPPKYTGPPPPGGDGSQGPGSQFNEEEEDGYQFYTILFNMKEFRRGQKLADLKYLSGPSEISQLPLSGGRSPKIIVQNRNIAFFQEHSVGNKGEIKPKPLLKHTFKNKDIVTIFLIFFDPDVNRYAMRVLEEEIDAAGRTEVRVINYSNVPAAIQVFDHKFELQPGKEKTVKGTTNLKKSRNAPVTIMVPRNGRWKRVFNSLTQFSNKSSSMLIIFQPPGQPDGPVRVITFK